MTNTMLHWHDAAKENPQREGMYLVALEGCAELTITPWRGDGFEWPWAKLVSASVQFWAAIPTAEQVRQKFRDADLRDQARAEQLGVSVKAYRNMVELLDGEPDGIITDRF